MNTNKNNRYNFLEGLSKMTIEELVTSIMIAKTGSEPIEDIPVEIVEDFEEMHEWLANNQDACYPPITVLEEEVSNRKTVSTRMVNVLETVLGWNEFHYLAKIKNKDVLIFNAQGALVNENKNSACFQYKVESDIETFKKNLIINITQNEEDLEWLKSQIKERKESKPAIPPAPSWQKNFSFLECLAVNKAQETFYFFIDVIIGEDTFDELPTDFLITIEKFDKWLEENEDFRLNYYPLGNLLKDLKFQDSYLQALQNISITVESWSLETYYSLCEGKKTIEIFEDGEICYLPEEEELKDDDDSEKEELEEHDDSEEGRYYYSFPCTENLAVFANEISWRLERQLKTVEVLRAKVAKKKKNL